MSANLSRSVVDDQDIKQSPKSHFLYDLCQEMVPINLDKNVNGKGNKVIQLYFVVILRS